MVNKYTEATDARQKVIEFETKLLEFSGLELNKELFVYDVEIELNGRKHSIHTYRCGNENGDKLLLIHGYAGSSALYYKMLKTLGEKFHVYCIDIIGMGLSSKEEFQCQTTEETIEFLTGSIDKWREAVGIEKFNLAGHSFGAYTSMQYALRFKERVKKLSLLSPVGFTKHKEQTPEEIAAKEKEMGFIKRTLFKWLSGYAKKASENKVTPQKLLNDYKCIGPKIIKRYAYKTFKLQKDEGKAMFNYLKGMLSLPEGSEKAIHYILKPPRFGAHFPLESDITELNIPVDCYFGQTDYMDTTGATRFFESKVKVDFALKRVPESQHQVTMQNPDFLANDIVVSALA